MCLFMLTFSGLSFVKFMKFMGSSTNSSSEAESSWSELGLPGMVFTSGIMKFNPV